jgi:hypothetical protein
VIINFPKKYIEKVNKFTEDHKKALDPWSYDYNKTAISQGYSIEYLKSEIETIKKEAMKLLKEGGKYSCSKYNDYSSYYCLLPRLTRLVNCSLETLYRIPNIVALENPELSEEYKNLIPKEKGDFYAGNREILNKRIKSNTTIDDINNQYSPLELINLENLLEEGRKGYDRLTGKSIKITESLMLDDIAKDEYKIPVDEIFPIELLKLDRNSSEVQKYLSLVCDSDLLLDIQNYRSLLIHFDYSPFFIKKSKNELIKTFWKIYPEIRNEVLSVDHISEYYPKEIKMILTIEYGR